MSAKSKITQNDLRKFMSLHRKKLTETTKRVESPLAKYLPDGTLKCILCNAVVESDSLWVVHINAKQHRDNISRRKFGNVPEVDRSENRIAAERLKNDGFLSDLPSKRVVPIDMDPPPPPKKIKSILKNGSTASVLPVGFFDAPKTQKVVNKVEVKNEDAPSTSKKIKLEEPEDVEMKTPEEQVGVFTESDLPEGFFDNPLLDAKARNVEYKDPVEEEWERFQKEMKEEVSLSTQIIEDESEVATVERQIVEVDEQLKNWSRVLDLEKKKETLQSTMTMAQDVKKEEESGSSGDEDLEEFVSWRTKKSFR